ncbi:hypothetical protein [Candidatus Chlorohelix sp.]|uniref:lipase/acyltransferase domain-containing protein n=1 Tax=Candidatus Chlorohelix sp. TaxID=3139201 RepID=UPI0030738E82
MGANLLKDGLRPLVVVPGLLGTWLPDSAPRGKIDPVSHIYDNLLDILKAVGYVPGVSLFAYPYDWRQDMRQLGADLGDFIRAIRELGASGKLTKPASMTRPGATDSAFRALSSFFKASSNNAPKIDFSKVDIIAHSMGGLVARSYLQNGHYPEDVARLVTLSTPHSGLMAAYYAAIGGDSAKIGVPPNIAANMMGIIQAREAGYFRSIPLILQLLRGKYQADLFKIFNQQMPSVQQLLPTAKEPYLYALSNGQEVAFPYGGNPPNTFLDELNALQSLKSLNSLEEIWCFVSASYQTRFRAQVQNNYAQTQPRWKYGEPLTDQPSQSFEPGDTLVTNRWGQLPLGDSTFLNNKYRVVEVDKQIGKLLNHVEIVYDPASLRYILGQLLRDETNNPRVIGAEVWNKPSINANKVDYFGLFF